MRRPGFEFGRWLTLVLVLIGVPAAFWLGFSRLQVDSDVLAALPAGDLAMESARRVLDAHPALEQVVVDLEVADGSTERLFEAAETCSKRMRESGLFAKVGLNEAAQDFAGFLADLPARLPFMFDEKMLEQDVAPRLDAAFIRGRLLRSLNEMASLDGVGQAELLAADPLGLHELVFQRLASLSPSPGARMRAGHLLSADGKHVLLLAEPKGRGTDTVTARGIESLFVRLKAEIPAEIRLRAMGSWRAALDNERMARSDTERAVWIATIGILLLLLLCFPRPWLGLLALLPAFAGISAAMLVYSLFEDRISALALGFGGALVAITVDHGIAFLRFLDGGEVKSGRDAARRVWSVGLFATLTTVGAFAALTLSGFSILAQVGILAALGVGFAFAFVHLVMPRLLPRPPAGRKTSLLPVESWLGWVGGGRRFWPAMVLVLLVGVGLSVLGPPGMKVDLQGMNSVSPATREAEQALEKTWGQMGRGPSLMLEAESLPALLLAGSRLAPLLEQAVKSEQIEEVLGPWDLAPTGVLAQDRLAAWRKFFSPSRRLALIDKLEGIGLELGFARDAFAPFIARLEPDRAPAFSLPPGVLKALGVVQAEGAWRWFANLRPASSYDGSVLVPVFERAQVAVFEPALFSERLGDLLGRTFESMVLLVALAVVILLVFLFMDLLLVLTTILPLLFAGLASLLGLRLLGHPLDLPSLMLAVVVLGMGVDYALYLVRGQQRFFEPSHPAMGPVRVTVLLAGGSTLIGMLSLLSAEHAVPRSAGVSMALGIGFALLGSFLILPPLLNRLFSPVPFPKQPFALSSADHARALRRRYRRLEPGFRFFARFKLSADPMFPKLAEWLSDGQRLLDIGCGLGVPATWLALARRDLRVVGIEPVADRARVARRVLGERGQVHVAAAPDLSAADGLFDRVMMLDMVHYLDETALAETLAGVVERLKPEGRMILRATLPEEGRFLERGIEALRIRLRGERHHWRSQETLLAALQSAGLRVELVEASAPGRCEWWFVASRGEAAE
ncbi:MAG: MMPL family transporter [Deltaproteobacteria bacterium]|nr:MMPL family transporter [Deltaproteobacteria bacterium]